MPLILDPARVPEETLRTMARELATELREVLDSLDDRGPAKDPLGIVTARDLLAAAIRLAEETEGGSIALTAAVVNVEYETLLAAIDLIKTHYGLPTVPRARPPGP
jgi:hypothetical protein